MEQDDDAQATDRAQLRDHRHALFLARTGVEQQQMAGLLQQCRIQQARLIERPNRKPETDQNTLGFLAEFTVVFEDA
ncbi:MAG: hypothetical protein ABT05_06440 [Lautropia sp. SCN 66-9]|nr:MAG: hypothetical protein ABT05_06440 [Lautropia sp. SCN 66-9]